MAGSTISISSNWAARWQGLSNQIEGLLTLLGAPVVPGGTSNQRRKNILIHLTGCLKLFAQSQFDFFCDGFGMGATPPSYTLQPSRIYPPDYVFRILLNQIASDLEAIERAVSQTIHSASNPSLPNTLDTGDKLAWAALKPALHLFPHKPDLTAIVYLNKSPVIRVIPYAPVALVGIPYTAQSTNIDYLAIPHEIGHYVYWHGLVNDIKMREVVKANMKLAAPPIKDRWLFSDWMEEMFADVYGCMLAGPVIAQDFQDLCLENPRTTFSDDNDGDDHPAAVIRPEIYIKTFLAQNPARAAMASALLTEWRTRAQTSRLKLRDETTVSVTDLINTSSPTFKPEQPVENMIQAIMNAVNSYPGKSVNGDWAPGATGPSDLYAAFNPGAVGSASPPDALAAPGAIWQEWIKRVGYFGAGNLPPATASQVIPPGEPSSTGEISDEGCWLPVLNALDWTVAPGGNSWRG